MDEWMNGWSCESATDVDPSINVRSKLLLALRPPFFDILLFILACLLTSTANNGTVNTLLNACQVNRFSERFYVWR